MKVPMKIAQVAVEFVGALLATVMLGALIGALIAGVVWTLRLLGVL